VNRVQRIYIKDLVTLFVSLTLSLSALFSVVSLIDRLDELMRMKVKGGGLVFYVLLRIPEFMKYLFPMCLLLSVIFVLGLASRRNELTVLKASGQNLRGFFLPFIFLGIVAVVVNFLVAEVLTPYSLGMLQRYVMSQGKEASFKSGKNGLWLKGKDGSIVHAGLFLPDGNILKDVSVFYIKDGLLYKRIEAEKGIWYDKGIELKKVWIYQLVQNRTEYRDSYKIRNAFSRKGLIFERKRLMEMGVDELIKYNRLLNESGFRNIKLEVDIHSRLSYPLTNLFMLLVGIVISVKSRKGRGILSAGAGVLISLAYWFLFTFALSLGYAGVLSPVFSGWLIPVGSLIAGFYMFKSIPR